MSVITFSGSKFATWFFIFRINLVTQNFININFVEFFFFEKLSITSTIFFACHMTSENFNDFWREAVKHR